MRIEFLGTGGATTIPRPGCRCRVCVEARQRGVPYSRSGPAVFVHGPDILIDTPEEIKDQLNRAGIERINAGTYSHWHPDHTMGRRIWEALNVDFRNWPPSGDTTDIYLPEQVAIDFQSWLGLQEHFDFMARRAMSGFTPSLMVRASRSKESGSHPSGWRKTMSTPSCWSRATRAS